MRKTLVESNPHLPMDRVSKANTPLKKGTAVYLSIKARDAAKAHVSEASGWMHSQSVLGVGPAAGGRAR